MKSPAVTEVQTLQQKLKAFILFPAASNVSCTMSLLHTRFLTLVASQNPISGTIRLYEAQHTCTFSLLYSQSEPVSLQSIEAPSSIAVTSPGKSSPSRQISTSRLLEHAGSGDCISKKGLIAALPKAAVRRGGFKVGGTMYLCFESCELFLILLLPTL